MKPKTLTIQFNGEQLPILLVETGATFLYHSCRWK